MTNCALPFFVNFSTRTHMICNMQCCAFWGGDKLALWYFIALILLAIQTVQCTSGGYKGYVVYLCWPIAPSFMSPNAGRGGVSQWVQLYTGAQINFEDLTPYLTYGLHHSLMSISIPIYNFISFPCTLRYNTNNDITGLHLIVQQMFFWVLLTGIRYVYSKCEIIWCFGG